MKIGIASPISSFFFKDYLNQESALLAEKLSNHDAPAVTNLARSFLDMGHELVIFTKDTHATKKYLLEGEKIKIFITPSSMKGWRKILGKLYIYDLILISKMFLSNEKLDVLSVQWTRDYAIGARHYFGKCPVTCTVRDILPVISKMQPISKVVLWQNEYTMRCKSYRFISNSEYTHNMVKRLWKNDSVIIHNGISEEFLDYHPMAKFDSYTFVTISTSIDGRKNTETLLNAYRLFHTNHPLTQLLLVGPPFQRTNPKVLSWEQTGLLEGVVLCGAKNRSELKEILSQSHCLIHPALEETFGNILIEAMACKCLTIGGVNSGAVPYVLHHGKCGLLCDVSNINSIAEVMENAYLFDHNAIINYGFEIVHSEFSPSVVASKYIDFFNYLIGKNK